MSFCVEPMSEGSSCGLDVSYQPTSCRMIALRCICGHTQVCAQVSNMQMSAWCLRHVPPMGRDKGKHSMRPAVPQKAAQLTAAAAKKRHAAHFPQLDYLALLGEIKAQGVEPAAELRSATEDVHGDAWLHQIFERKRCAYGRLAHLVEKVREEEDEKWQCCASPRGHHGPSEHEEVVDTRCKLEELTHRGRGDGHRLLPLWCGR